MCRLVYVTETPILFSSSTKNGGLADSETLNIPYSPCFPYMHTGLYSDMVAKQCELDQIRTERELAIAKARLRAVNEVHDSDAMSQTLESTLLERLPYANYIESVMQGKCVNNPGNEVDSRFEGNGMLTPDMSQLLERLPDANCVDGLMQGDSVHNPGNEVDSQFDGNGVVPPGDCGIDGGMISRHRAVLITGESIDAPKCRERQ